MTKIDILANFEREINLINDPVNKPSTEDSLYWLNQAVVKFIKLRFNGDFVHKTSYEQNEKRTRDLIYLLRQFECTPKKRCLEGYTKFHVTYPSDFLYALSEDVLITDTNGEYPENTSVFECTADSFMYRMMNSLTDFHYHRHKARPIRVRTIDGCDLLTDGKYYVQRYTLGYLRLPKEITLDSPFSEYTDFTDEVMFEIIKMAALMYIENSSDATKRYESISNEVNTQE